MKDRGTTQQTNRWKRRRKELGRKQKEKQTHHRYKKRNLLLSEIGRRSLFRNRRESGRLYGAEGIRGGNRSPWKTNILQDVAGNTDETVQERTVEKEPAENYAVRETWQSAGMILTGGTGKQRQRGGRDRSRPENAKEYPKRKQRKKEFKTKEYVQAGGRGEKKPSTVRIYPPGYRKQNEIRLQIRNKGVRSKSKNGWSGLAAVRQLFAGQRIGKSRRFLSVLPFAAGGVGVIVGMICLVGMLLASPFGVFFSGRGQGAQTMTIAEAVQTINREFSAEVSEIMESADYDEWEVHSLDGMLRIDNWSEILAIYAVRMGIEEESVTMNPDKLDLLRSIAQDMVGVDVRIEVLERENETENENRESEPHSSNEQEDAEAEEREEAAEEWVILHLTMWKISAQETAIQYGFTPDQLDLLQELLKPQYQELFVSLAGSYGEISVPDREEILAQLPDELSEERRAVVLAAYSLVGKVDYFWGGKSYVMGWDSCWGILTKVTAEGSESTGSIRPYGLDCSGYVGWVFYNALNGYRCVQGAASQYREWCEAIAWEQLQPGDLVFYQDLSHVGIVVYTEADSLTIAQCGDEGVSIAVQAGKAGGSFCLAGRPKVFDE